MEFKRYESRPITRLAYQIKPTDEVRKLPDSSYGIVSGSEVMTFKAYEPPVAGDYIVYLTDDDTYHCSNAVFIERNIVPTKEEVHV